MATWDSLRRRTVDRNRLNQRNFRTRRQAYVKELEQRIRKLEDEGVWATKEVQFAAQQVQKENRLLRSLLETQFGVDAYQISKYLFELNNATDINAQKSLQLGNRMGRSGVSEELASNCMLATNPGEAGRARATQDFNFTGPTRAHEEKQGVESSPEFPDYGYRSPLTLSTGMDTLQPVQVESQINLISNRPPTTQETLAPIECQLRDRRCETGLGNDCRPRGIRTTSEETHIHAEETSCEEAARIIAGLRGRNNPDDVWNELGCGTSQSCRVKNLAVFELMDREQPIPWA
ncbi:uncharacterized protein PV07_00856 [Cladophialophora immunda]|uniref:BZIP domain-containing protein n=1 Tax=Cladophialophora immunda TaxID=569365 RepID=A0A0D2DEG0_9EURO|nr:uncharacterized protein PV07_00856 [Cladophialophora immunda]KIW34054.1 hypothetical protein PV07_00856 [Cladophialophora immunda]